MAPEKLITAKNLMDFMHQVPGSTLLPFYMALDLVPGNRAELFKRLKERMGNLSWDIARSGQFHHERTHSFYRLDEIGFKYNTGLSLSEEDLLQQHPAPTHILDNGLEFWIRDKSPYLIADYLHMEGDVQGVKYMTERMGKELEKIVHLFNHGATFKEMGASKHKPKS
jgi:hypothetical protein